MPTELDITYPEIKCSPTPSWPSCKDFDVLLRNNLYRFSQRYLVSSKSLFDLFKHLMPSQIFIFPQLFNARVCR